MSYQSASPADRPGWFASLFDYLRRKGALKPVLCRWERARGEAIARYACGCFIAWLDDPRVELPPDGYDGDEGAFAEQHLGPLLREKGCERHGNYSEPARVTSPRRGYWTEARCEAYGHVPGRQKCPRCGADRRATKAEG
jgi:hypothetical protein